MSDGSKVVPITVGPADAAAPTGLPQEPPVRGRVKVDGKFFDVGGARWPVKGLTYGPFAPGPANEAHFLPDWPRVRLDLRQVSQLGANALRVYHVPPRRFLDEAAEAGLRVLVDVPWQKHRCFFEDWDAQADALRRVRAAATDLGDHPALFAISVANEFPPDVVRFYGRRRIERFVDRLIDAARQARPECLTTFCNYPSTEFLDPAGIDFLCFNVYLNDPTALAAYLDRLQHFAGARPLVLGEHGLDSLRHGESAQADAVADQVARVFRRGLAGSFVFSYTDDWFTGGHQVEGWAFGVTDRHRRPKPAADRLRATWERAANGSCGHTLPKASVIVCSYNGAATLDECLRSLGALNYPDYDVILVDDGSTDDTPAIAARFPRVRYVRQDNLGLSVARNVGARAATGEVAVYTDSDCVADPDWLLYLVGAMREQRVDAIGGPNVPPPSDRWTAKCVAASPGGPSHVMLDDRRAEHVPGCNMAFDRAKLLSIGGFDPQFRQAGDDVDVCWRFMDAGWSIGFAPAALVWHHRRATVRAYLRQQKGYGRAEAMLRLKHPHRFNRAGAARWHGVIYGEGAVGLPLCEPVIYHGRFGAGLFQAVYRQNRYSPWSYLTLLEWHVLTALVAVAGLLLLLPPLLWAAAAMALASLAAAVRTSAAAPLPAGAPRWCRPLVTMLHLAQPVVRGWHRHAYWLTHKRAPRPGLDGFAPPAVSGRAGRVKRVGAGRFDLYWSSDEGRGREALLEALTARARAAGWHGQFGCGWAAWDARLGGDAWHDLTVRTATEELGGPRRFTRARTAIQMTGLAKFAVGSASALTLVSATDDSRVGLVVAGMLWAVLLFVLFHSRRRCTRSVAALLARAGDEAGLAPVGAARARPVARTPAAPAHHAAADDGAAIECLDELETGMA